MGASLGYFYAIKTFDMSLENITEHLQSNIAQLDLDHALKKKIEQSIQQHLDQLMEYPSCLKQFKSFALPEEIKSSYA
jgi:hypothetical protein